MRRKLAIATGSRADWGLLSPLAKRLSADADVMVLATNMHLRPESGMTVNEIIADGFQPLWIPTEGAPEQILAQTIEKFAEALADIRPDALIILGDRFEMLGAATASLMKGVPIVHIAGGTVSEGAFDDSIRHAITKMAILHFPETEEYRSHIVSMGEEPERVITAGAIGISNLGEMELLDKQELEHFLGISLQHPLLLATLHAATLDAEPPLRQMQNFLDALKSFPGTIVFTYPNNDVDPEPQIRAMELFCKEHPDKTVLVPSLGRLRYYSLLRIADAVVGNSSSGIVEAASFGTPTLDIGCRQQGRARACSVVHCDSDTKSIEKGLEKVLSEQVRQIALKKENPYYRPDTVELMASSILNYPFTPFPSKRFFISNSATIQS